MTKFADYSELEMLAEAQRDGDLSPERHRRLAQLLRNPDARRHYVRYQLLHAELRMVFDGDTEAEPMGFSETDCFANQADSSPSGCNVPSSCQNPESTEASEFERFPSLSSGQNIFQAWPIVTMFAIFVAVTLGSAVMVFKSKDRPAGHAAPVAEVVASLGASWGTGVDLPDGTPLSAGELKLNRGLAEIRFGDGANVILEAPVDCVLDSSSRMRLRQGRLSARVPSQAIGFTVHTDHATVVDLGTEFGLSSQGNNGTDVHVFRGQVALATPNGSKSDPELLGEGVGRSVKRNGSFIENIRANELAFVSPKEFEARLMAMSNEPYYRWLAFSYHLRREPALVLYYVFDNAIGKPARVMNCAGATAGKLDGLFGDGDTTETCPEWVAPGRWSAQSAIRFDGSRKQTVHVPSDNELIITQAATIATWIRPNTALLESDVAIVSKRQANGSSVGPNYELGLTCQSNTGQEKQWSLYFKTGNRQVISPKVKFVPGKWVHLAATVNADHTVLYVNGQPVVRENGVEFTPHAGDLWIGCAPAGPKTGDAPHEGPFEGLISELVLARRVMTDQEIHQIYVAGTPAP